MKTRSRRKRFLAFFVMITILSAVFQKMPTQDAKAYSNKQKANFKGEGYEVTFNVTSQWNTAFNATVTIKNTSNTKIDNWAIEFNMPYEITNIWNGKVYSSVGGTYIIKNVGSNQDIDSKKSVSFGFTANAGKELQLPDKYKMITEQKKVDANKYELTYKVVTEWDKGFSGEIKIKNISDEVLEDWNIEFDFDKDIDCIWNATILKHTGNHYVLTNSGYNQNISAGDCVNIGFNGHEKTNGISPNNYQLSSYQLYDGSSPDLDTDGDGFSDLSEKMIGSDYRLADTDGDGLTDWEEYCLCNTSPVMVDTDQDTINDADDDEDNDGLSNILEIKNGTDSLVADTDGDGLNDYEELYTYNTNPLLQDTDGDSLSDYDDVVLGFSPLLQDTDSDGILDCDEKMEQTYTQEITDENDSVLSEVSVKMETSGNIDNNVAISNMWNIDKMSSDVVGLIGVPVDIHCSSDFDKAVITFKYNKDKLGTTSDDNLAILWYDKDNNWYQVLDQESVIDKENCTVSYTTTHFSTYMLVDKSIWFDTWRNNLDYRGSSITTKEKYFDLNFVVDVSGSMSGTRINTAKQALNGFVGALAKDDRASITRFVSTAYTITNFTSDKDILYKAVSNLYASGGTNVNSGLVEAVNNFSGIEDSTNTKVIVLICDGDVNYVQSTIDSCKNFGIKIYAVNVGASSSSSLLKKMAEETEGEYYYCPTADSIKPVLGSIQNTTVNTVDPTDTDHDGLYDVYETTGFRLINGRIIHTNPNTEYTDTDHLTDYEEVGLVYNMEMPGKNSLMMDRYIGKGEIKPVQIVLMYSDPSNKDSDHDGKLDHEDKTPWTYDVNSLKVYQSKRKVGLEDDGLTKARDLFVGDNTKKEILDIDSMFKYTFYDAELGSDVLFYELENMSLTFFATGDMEDVISDMIKHFKDGIGTDYRNATLTNEVYENESTQKYVEKVKSEVVDYLHKNFGNLNDLALDSNDQGIMTNILKECRPIFHSNSDILHGLTICINDTWGNYVEVKDYVCDGESFSGTLHFCIYDNFGLDIEDVKKIYVNLAGFRSWYVLQHYDQYNKQFMPFVDYMEFDVPFEGRIPVFKSAN